MRKRIVEVTRTTSDICHTNVPWNNALFLSPIHSVSIKSICSWERVNHSVKFPSTLLSRVTNYELSFSRIGNSGQCVPACTASHLSNVYSCVNRVRWRKEKENERMKRTNRQKWKMFRYLRFSACHMYEKLSYVGWKKKEKISLSLSRIHPLRIKSNISIKYNLFIIII